MSRTTIEIKLRKDIDGTISTINSIFRKHGYENQIFKGENIWSKGDGVIVVMSCFGYTFSDDSVILQGWIRDAILGESKLEGFMAMAIKKKMKSIINEIEQLI